MAAPTITWYPVTNNGGSPQRGNAITIIDFGNVEAGYWSDVKCVQAGFTGNSARTLKFWLNDTASTGGNQNVSSSASWKHRLSINTNFFNPADVQITADVKNGTATNPVGENFATTPETEPSSSNFGDEYTVASGAYTKYIYLCLQPPSNASDGLTQDWGFRLSFLYP